MAAYQMYLCECKNVKSYPSNTPLNENVICPKCKRKMAFSGYTASGWSDLSNVNKEYTYLSIFDSKKESTDESSKEADYKSKLDEFIITTTNNVEGYDIVKYCGVYSGEEVIGTGLFSDVGAGVSDLLGTKSTSYSSKLGQAKKNAVNDLVKICIMQGANAVVGVDIDIMTVGSNMFVACANGTAVQIKKRDV